MRERDLEAGARPVPADVELTGAIGRNAFGGSQTGWFRYGENVMIKYVGLALVLAMLVGGVARAIPDPGPDRGEGRTEVPELDTFHTAIGAHYRLTD
jgi:hypothetical protein